MKHLKLHSVILILLMAASGLSAQPSSDGGKRNYVIGFYNLENLFDTYNDPAKNDEEFLPE